jgi:transcriptional regulator with XRE-family HTH domain
MKLGEFIKESRLNRGLSQHDFSKMLNVSYVSLNRAELYHRCGNKLLKALNEVTGVSIAELRQMMVEKNELHK